MIAPSMASAMGLKTKPGNVHRGLQSLGREAARRRDEPVLRGDELQLALAHRLRRLQHGEDRRGGLAQRGGDVAALRASGP